MKLSTKKSQLQKALNALTSVVSRKVTMPILGCVLLRANSKGLEMSATNLDLGLVVKIPCVCEEFGDYCVPLAKFLSIIQSLSNEEVEIELKKTQLSIKAGGSRFLLPGLESTEFPPVLSTGANPEKENILTIEQSVLETALAEVSAAASRDENRYILNGVYFLVNDNENKRLSLVATDGRRLHLHTAENPVDAAAHRFILPNAAVAALKSLLGVGKTVEVSSTDRKATFSITAEADADFVGEFVLVSKLVEGNFPNFRQVIPRESSVSFSLEREGLLAITRRVALVCDEKSSGVKWTLDGNSLSVAAQSSAYGEGTDKMDVEVLEKAPYAVMYDPHYMVDVLAALGDDKIQVDGKDELSPIVLKTKTLTAIIMPLRMP
jgi:DNA polymerase-3 subunit beta